MERQQNTPNDRAEAIKAAETILSSDGKDLRSFLYRDIVLNALKCRDLDILDLKIIDRAVAEIQHAACVFQPYRSVRKVSMFGSARVAEGDPYYELAVNLGRAVADKGFMVITGGADGIMKAGIQGAKPQNSFGVNILLPSEQTPSSIMQDDTKLVTFKYFFARKLFFVMEADAVALFPGGFGTQDEGFEVLTLLQTGKAPLMPVVLMELPQEHYWEAWDQFVREQMLARGFINPEDMSFFRIMRSPLEAADWIKSYYDTFHSFRQFRNRLIVRLEKELPDSAITVLNEQFHDLVESGKIYRTPPLPAEADEPGLASKPRIAFSYNRKSAGRLNEMVLMINKLGRSPG